MVEDIQHKGKTYYRCPECDMYFKEKKYAEQCEESCKTKKCCETTIMKHAVKLP